MKRLGKFLAYTLFFILALMIFIPKTSVYYFGEKNLKKFDVVISKETLNESLFSLKVENLDISAKAVDTAHIKSVEMIFLGVYNSVDFHDIKLSSLVEAYLPSKIESLSVEYSLLHPLSIRATSNGEFGEVDASFDFLDLNATAILKPSNVMLKKYKKSLRFFKKSKNGEYVYAKNI